MRKLKERSHRKKLIWMNILEEPLNTADLL